MVPHSRFSPHQDLFHPARPRQGSSRWRGSWGVPRPGLTISGLGPRRTDEDEILLSQSVVNNPLGVKLVPHSGYVGPRRVGEAEESQVTHLPPSLSRRLYHNP